MICITYHATPMRAPMLPTDTAGAYVNCWINTANATEAKEIAQKFLAEEFWVIESLDDIERIDINTHEPSIYLQEALEQDACYVFYLYPLVEEAEEEETVTD